MKIKKERKKIMGSGRLETAAVHAGEDLGSLDYSSTHAPVFRTNTFSGKEIEEFERGNKHFYTRISNPNQAILEEKYNALHGGHSTLVFGSGMAAISAFFTSLLKAGEPLHVVASSPLYGGTYYLLKYFLPKRFPGFSVSFFNTFCQTRNDLLNIIRPETKIIYVETPANPTLSIFDIMKIAHVAKQKNILFAVDNTFASAFNQRPFEHGADIVIESLTKYTGDDGKAMGGIIIMNRGSFHLAEELLDVRSTMGGILSPESADAISNSINTLPCRLRQHNESALMLAEELNFSPYVSHVYYPGLKNNAGCEIAKHQMITPDMKNGFGGVVSFELKGGEAEIKRFGRIIAATFVKLAVSLGSSETMIAHPYSMLYGKLSMLDRGNMHIWYNLFRVSVGLENPDDIRAAFKDALKDTYK